MNPELILADILEESRATYTSDSAEQLDQSLLSYSGANEKKKGMFCSGPGLMINEGRIRAALVRAVWAIRAEKQTGGLAHAQSWSAPLSSY